MRRKMSPHALALAFSALTFIAPAAHAADPAVGLWLTIDDKTQKPNGVVEIAEMDGELVGYVRQIIAGSGENPDPVCEDCTDERKGKPIKGMKILSGVRKTDAGYSKGSILDPDEGKVYRCQITLAADGGKLEVRGYIGIPLLGRTQVWLRQTAGDQPAPGR